MSITQAVVGLGLLALILNEAMRMDSDRSPSVLFVASGLLVVDILTAVGWW